VLLLFDTPRSIIIGGVGSFLPAESSYARGLLLTVQIQGWLDRLHGGDETARGELLNCACDRLRNLARKMLLDYPHVQRWEQTDDVLQNAALRLHRTLAQIPVATSRDFFRLAALNIRRELLDLARHYYGPQGRGARHATDPGTSSTTTPGASPADAPDLSHEPTRLAAWSEFHRQIEALPEEGEVFDLLWYQGAEPARGSPGARPLRRTVKRRWLAASSSCTRLAGRSAPVRCHVGRSTARACCSAGMS
jgi:RNA polymerase sigma-70 factor (ECF subfamily)